MRRIVLILAVALAGLGCRSAAPAWERAPLAPTLRFGEAVAPGEVLVLVLDAHTGAPVAGPSSGGIATLSPPAPAPGRWQERVDSAGRIRLRGVPAGAYELRVRAFGYEDWRAAVALGDTAGWVALAQLRRREIRLQRAIVRGALRSRGLTYR